MTSPIRWTGAQWFARPVSAALLDGLRAFNAELPEADRIRFAGLDANDWPGIFQEYLRIFQDRFGTVNALAELMAAPADGPAHEAALAALPTALEAQAGALTASLGGERYALLVELVEVERQSLPFRRTQDKATWELLIRGRILGALSVGTPVAINMGCGTRRRCSNSRLRSRPWWPGSFRSPRCTAAIPLRCALSPARRPGARRSPPSTSRAASPSTRAGPPTTT